MQKRNFKTKETKKIVIHKHGGEMAKKSKADYPIEKLLSFDEVSDATGLTVAYLRKAVYSLGLPSYKAGGRKFRLSEVETWLKQRREADAG